MTRKLALAIIIALAPAGAMAEPCPGNPQALGTAREIQVDVKTEPRIGRKQFPSTLPLHDKELVLTFDDGPWPGTTSRVLDALKSECVRATFFLLGRNVSAHPELARRALAAGHSIGHQAIHTRSSAICRWRERKAISIGVSRQMSSRFTACGGRSRQRHFFVFRAFASNAALLDRMKERGLVVFGADVWASDWVSMTPDRELHLILSRIEQAGRGIVLFHDTKAQTAQMLPAFLHELKKRGFRIVHVTPSGSPSTR